MAKILVISDNAQLSEHLLKVHKSCEDSKAVGLDLHYSRSNKQPSAMIILGAEPIDIKNEVEVSRVIDEYDLVISLHCKQIFPPRLVESVTCINFHPGLNPYNRGWYPQVFSIINRLPAGATVHLMDAEVDHGAIIDQIAIPIYISDTSLHVYNRVVEAEKILIDRHLGAILRNDFTATMPCFEGNYNSISDFKALCHLDLNNVSTLREHLDLLRSLTHGDFKNAYFEDENGKKFSISVAIDEC